MKSVGCVRSEIATQGGGLRRRAPTPQRWSAEKKPSLTARMWAYRSVLVPLDVFAFTVSRHRDGPDQFLFLALYQQLYDVEDRAGPLAPADRQALREADARPIWNRMRDLLDSDAAKQALPKDKIAEALNYLRHHWDALSHYLRDGRVPIDNNDTEQLMKQVALGRKNWLFLGSVAAGERTANFLTLVSSALRNDLDVSAYVKAVLDTLLAGSTDYAALRPHRWAAAHPEAIRAYRQEERRDRYARKSARRAERRLAAPDSS